MSTKPGAPSGPTWMGGMPAEGAKPSWMAPKRTRASTKPPKVVSEPPRILHADDRAASSAHAAQLDRAEPAYDEIEPLLVRMPPVDLAPRVAELEEELAEARAGIVALTESIARVRDDVLRASERDLVELSIAIAERVIGRVVKHETNLFAAWAREAVVALGERDEITVALAPDVAAAVPSDAWEGTPRLRAELDASLPAGRVEVRGKFARVDADVRARLDAVIEALDLESE
jgi:hypothetical protein